MSGELLALIRQYKKETNQQAYYEHYDTNSEVIRIWSDKFIEWLVTTIEGNMDDGK